MAESNNLAIIVHHNNEVTVRDERGYPAVCRDCRFSGWKDKDSYSNHAEPPRCLHHSGGADPVDGDRMMERFKGSWDWDPDGAGDKLYPRCKNKNPDGKCEDFVRAKPLPWSLRTLWYKVTGREWRWPRMRL